MPHARNTDPITSHEAAAGLDPVSLTKTKQAILNLLAVPMTDDQIRAAYGELVALGLAPAASESGLRTRRSELHQHGFIKPVGYGQSGYKRRAIIWQQV